MSVPEIEKITAFKNICPYLDVKRQEELARELGIDGVDLDRRLEGLRNEDEFVLILHFLRSCKHLIPFEEGAPQLTGTAAPDLLVQLHSGEKLLIEVKSSEKDLLKLGTGRVKKCMAVAEDLGLPLYFALKQRGVWGLFSAEHVLAQTGKLRLVEDFTKSEFDAKFGSQWYMLPGGLEFHYLYQHDGVGLVQSKHGPLVRFAVRFRGKRIMQATGTESNMFAAHMLRAVALQGKQDEPLGGLTRGKYTKVVYRLPFNLSIADYHLYLRLIHGTSREGGAKYDRTTYLKNLQGREEPVTVDAARTVFRHLEYGGLTVLRVATSASPKAGPADGNPSA
ncbi:MAG: hypothetical protein V3W41_01685 [Planctomycetota bacterium]